MSVVILLETPESLQVGLDNLTLQTGKFFKGVKNVPEGAHYLYYRGQTSVSEFIYLNKSIEVRRWKSGRFASLSQEEQEVFEQGVQELLPVLVPYPNESFSEWKKLTSFIDKDLVEKLRPIDKVITEDSGVFYSTVPKRIVKPGVSGSDLTLINFDKSFALKQLIDHEYKHPQQVLGELQFAFICFMLGESLESFEQWKGLLNLLCNSEEAAQSDSSLLAEFIPVLCNQIASLPEDMTHDPLLSSSFLVSALSSFICILDNPGLPSLLFNRGQKLKAFIHKKFGTLCTEEEAPVIVET